jgi:hypothetical protein
MNIISLWYVDFSYDSEYLFGYWLAVPLDISVDLVTKGCESGRIEPHQIMTLQRLIISEYPGKDLFSNSQEIENTFEGFNGQWRAVK